MQPHEDSTLETLIKFADSRAEAIDFRIRGESSLIGKPLKEFRFKPQILIACIVRRGMAIIADGNTEIQKGDDVIVISGRESLHNIEEILL